MKVERVAKYLIPKDDYKPTKWQVFIEEFIESDDDEICLVAEPGEYASTASMYSCAYSAVDRFWYAVSVHMVNGEVHMMRDK